MVDGEEYGRVLAETLACVPHIQTHISSLPVDHQRSYRPHLSTCICKHRMLSFTGFVAANTIIAIMMCTALISNSRRDRHLTLRTIPARMSLAVANKVHPPYLKSTSSCCLDACTVQFSSRSKTCRNTHGHRRLPLLYAKARDWQLQSLHAQSLPRASVVYAVRLPLKRSPARSATLLTPSCPSAKDSQQQFTLNLRQA
jgi:hypothetical protein